MNICMGCDEEIDIKNGYIFVEVHNKKLCQFCFEEKYDINITCHICETKYGADNPLVEIDGVVYCTDCAVAEFEIQSDEEKRSVIMTDITGALEVLQTVIDELKENGGDWANEILEENNVKKVIELGIEDLVNVIDCLDYEQLCMLSQFIDSKSQYLYDKNKLLKSCE